jgi:signal transduction histidine kinase
MAFPIFLLAEVASAGSLSSIAPIVWVGYLVLTVWALVLTRRRRPDALTLTLGAIGNFTALSVLEAISGREITALDFTAVFGLVMILSVLVGVLATARNYVWAVFTASFVAGWSLLMGYLQGDGTETTAIRGVIALVGVVFATVLLSKLLDLLGRAIALYNRSSRLHKAIARCSEALLVGSDAHALEQAVRALLEATEADYAYVDRTIEVDGEPGWQIVAEAGKQDVRYDEWLIGKYSAVPTAAAALLAGKTAIVHTRNLSGAERRTYQEAGIRSEVVVPIMMDGELRGSLGFADYREERDWGDDDIQTLWRASDMIAAYWRQQEYAESLKAASEAKDRLLASVSHEIRTPLAAIVGLSEEIASGAGGFTEGELKELNHIIATQSRELAELVEDLLVASRADAGSLSVSREAVDLVQQIDRVLEGVSQAIPNDKRILVKGGGIQAWGDPLRVRQVVRNLVTNALKYGGDEIVLSMESSGDRARLVVFDDGRGVPPDEADQIFDRYYRSAQSPTQAGSVGIGLSVARQLAELMGGTLEYVSTDGWHRFELSLPAVEVQAPETSDRDAVAPTELTLGGNRS